MGFAKCNVNKVSICQFLVSCNIWIESQNSTFTKSWFCEKASSDDVLLAGNSDIQWCFSQVKGTLDDDVTEGEKQIRVKEKELKNKITISWLKLVLSCLWCHLKPGSIKASESLVELRSNYSIYGKIQWMDECANIQLIWPGKLEAAFDVKTFLTILYKFIHFKKDLFDRSLFSADIISCVEFNQDGELLATGDKGGRVVIFQVCTYNSDDDQFFKMPFFFSEMRLLKPVFPGGASIMCTQPSSLMSPSLTISKV